MVIIYLESYLWCSVGGRILLQNPNCIGHSDRPMVLRCMKVYCYTLLFLNLCCYLNMWHSFWVSLLLCGIYLPKTIANNFDAMSTFWKSIYFFFPLFENKIEINENLTFVNLLCRNLVAAIVWCSSNIYVRKHTKM